jgi:hypothetical protein
MINKINALLLLLFVGVVLLSCSPSLPKNKPDLGMDIDISQLNTTITVNVPKGVNSYKLDKPVEIEITNLSNQVLEVRIDEVQLFRIDNGHWQKVPYKTKTIVVDNFIIEPNKINNAASLTLEPNGVFPGYKRFIDVVPDVKSDKTIFFRIFVIAHVQGSKNSPENIVGGFVDVYLMP